MSEENNLLICYNRGCGEKFDPTNNKDDSCIHHPGAPYFHDAYKGWSCCKKKCTDFTEFLNIRGCAKSFHNPVKPLEPEKPIVDKSKSDEVIIVRAPEPTRLERPPFDAPQVELECEVSAGLAEKAEALSLHPTLPTSTCDTITIGTSCKNNACKESYKDSESLKQPCVHHPGQPVFHEGAKFWTCCKRRTFDFETFLSQPGCVTGEHVWVKKEDPSLQKKVECRHDWHQTALAVVVTIYAKKYNPTLSKIRLSPIRLTVDLYFPERGEYFNMDVELNGVVDVTRSKANMLGTKVEIQLRKAEGGSWSKLFIPREHNSLHVTPPTELKKNEEQSEEQEPVDLSDL